jgi:ABC-type transport system involved in multi-copper enzyme maturation permease subunit
MKTIRQIFAIARTEFRFGFRRGAPVVMTALIGLIIGIGIVLLQISNLKDLAPTLNDMSLEKVERIAAAGFNVTDYQQWVTRFAADWTSAGTAPLGWMVMSLALLFLPIATVSAIPADRKFGVLEILRSTPITGGRFLAGKILGVLAIVLLTGLFPFLLFLVVLEGVQFSFLHISISMSILIFYFQLSLLDGIPLLACGSTIGVLTGVVFRTRRAALFPGLLAGVFTFLIWGFVFKAPPTSVPVVDVAAYYAFQNFHSDALAAAAKLTGLTPLGLLGEGAARVGIGQVFLMYTIIIVTFLLLAFLARTWLLWKENF